MDPSLWQRVEEVFLGAAGLSGSALRAHLDAACGDDAKLRDEVEGMLVRTRPDVDSFLAPPTLILAGDAESASLVGSRIGSTEIRKLIGEGGMGAVYEGVQAPWGRRVAVKVMRSGLSSPSARQRFDFEVRVLANLQHPSIAQVFESGVHEGPDHLGIPYFVMEFVPDARRVTEFATAQDLDVRSRCELMSRICAAVHHGHLKGVIHRDLKPANVLIDRGGTPKVIDFGVARTTDDDSMERSFVTAEGMIVGTPAYMSPEQLAGRTEDLDARTDVYSLGVILYELLTGERPHDVQGLSLPKLIERVTESAVLRPSRRRPGLSSDLDTIVLKALATEAGRRYDSAAALGDDLDRWRDGLPVLARPLTPGYQLRLFARRNRALVVATSVVAVVVVVGAIVAWTLAIQRERAREAEQQRAEEAERLLDHGHELSQWVINDLQRRLADLPGSTPLRQDLVERISGYLDALRAESGGRADLLQITARSYVTVAEIQGTLDGRGDPAKARVTLEKALPIVERLAALRPDDPKRRIDVLSVRTHIADYSAEIDDPEDARIRYEAVLAEAGPWCDHEVVGELALRITAQIQAGLAWLAEQRGDHRKASALMTAALDNLPTPRDDSGVDAWSSWLSWRQQLLHYTWNTGEVETARRIQVALKERLDALIPEGTRDVSGMFRRAVFHRVTGDFFLYADNKPTDAAGEYELAIGTLRRLHESDPVNMGFASGLGIALSRVGIARLRSADTTGARDAFQEALALAQQREAAAPENVQVRLNLRIALNQLGDIQVQLGEVEKGAALNDEALAIIQDLHDSDPDNLRFQSDLAEALTSLGLTSFGRMGQAGASPAVVQHHAGDARRHWRKALRLLNAVEKAAPGQWGVAGKIDGCRRYLELLTEGTKNRDR